MAVREASGQGDLGTGEVGCALVDVVVPAHNEADVLADSVRQLHEHLSSTMPFTWSVTIVDSGSTDGTFDVAESLASSLPGIRVVRVDEKGRGRAIRAAWNSSPSPVLAYMDVDMSSGLDALLPLVAPLVSGHSDVVVGTRLGHGAVVRRGPLREVVSRSYNGLLKVALRTGVSDAQCGFKAVRADVASQLLPHVNDEDWFFDTELLVLAERTGLRILEIPVDWVDDPDSRVHLARDSGRAAGGVWRMARTPVVVDGLADGPAGPRSSLSSQLMSFCSIGLVSTAAFAVLFLLLAGRIGPYLADVVALAVCALANTASNRRLTFALRGRRGRVEHYVAGLAMTVVPLLLNLAALATLQAAGVTSHLVMLAVLTVVNGAAAVGRFLLLRNWVFAPRPAGSGS